MKNKIKTTIITFIISLFFIMPTTNAQTMGQLTKIAIEDLDRFLSMPIERSTDGNTEPGYGHAHYCMDAFSHGGANGANMRTSVIDVGKNGISSVNGYSTTNSEAARRAMEVLYYATKSYINHERWGTANQAPYRAMMMQSASKYGGVMVNAGIFDSSLQCGFTEMQMIGQFGEARYRSLKAEGEGYVNSTKNDSFSDRSTKDIQSIQEVEDWVFIGPYKIQNSGSGSISDITVETMTGEKCHPEGWSTAPDKDTITYNKDLPNGTEFYLAFHQEKPDSAEKVSVTKKQDRVLRARMVFFASNGGQNLATYGGKWTSSTQTISLPKVPFSVIKITKVDADTKKPLPNVGFIIYNETERKWVKDGIPATYVNKKEEATTYITGMEGKVTIRNLSQKGRYKIYEVMNPHFGYREVGYENKKMINIGNIDITAIGQAKNETIENKRIYVKLSGCAWEDLPDGKEKQSNGLYYAKDKDKRLKNITVTLKKANGEIIDQKITNTITNTKSEQEEGAYLFGDYQRNITDKRILIEDLRGAYIEFEYNGMCYKSISLHIDLENGNKATDDTVRGAFNQKYGTIVQGKAQGGERDLSIQYQYKHTEEEHTAKILYGGNYIYGYKGQKYPITGIDEQYLIKANTKDATPNHLLGQTIYSIEDIYSQGLEEIPNINLGLKEREMPDISLVQDVDHAQVSLNGYTHTYYYRDRFKTLEQAIEDFKKKNPDIPRMFNVGVDFKTKYGDKYTTTIYSSDIVKNANVSPEDEGKLGVWITYKIKLTNEAYGVNTKINQLYNYYDPDYKIVKVKYENGRELDKKEYEKEEDFTDIKGKKYKKVCIQPTDGVKLEEKAHQYLEITYQLNDQAILNLLQQNRTLDSITEVVSYSSYEDKKWTKPYAGVDKDSEPNNASIGNTNTYEDDISSAPSLVLRSNATREINGTVWHENIIEKLLQKTGKEKQRIGDGKYEKEIEDVVGNVKVELLNDDATDTIHYGKVANLYPTNIDEVGPERKALQPVPAETSTDKDGNYKFRGVIPGEYIIRFTYKNDSILYRTDGTSNSLKEIISKESEGKVEGGVEYYKSTLFRTNRNKENGNLMEADRESSYWYVEDVPNGDRLSDAKDKEDLVNERTKVQEINHQTATTVSEIEEIQAHTNKMIIRMDCKVTEDELQYVGGDSTYYGDHFRYEFKNIDFGIVRRPKQDLKIKKEIAYVQVVLANGQIIIKGDPREEEIPYLKFLPNGNIHIELDNEIIQGATLKLDYEITADNTGCEIDYNDADYYYFGKVPEGHKGWKIATIKELFDYPNTDLNFDKEQNEGWEYVTDDNITIEKLIQDGKLSNNLKDVFKQYAHILSTEEFSKMEPGEIKKQRIKFTRLLSNTNDELAYNNDIEINTYEGRKIDYTIPGNYNPTDSSTSENDNATVNTIITGPTGGSKNYLPSILLGITSLVIVVAGIIWIKKIVK